MDEWMCVYLKTWVLKKLYCLVVVILAFIIGFLVKFTFNETFRGRLQLLTKLFR